MIKDQAYPSIRLSDIEEMQIDVPVDPRERRHIAAILDQADALRRKQESAISEANKLVGAVYTVMFGDPSADFIKFPTRRVADVCTLENGDRSSNYPSGDDILDAGVPFLSGKNFRGDELDWANTVFISKEKFASLSRGKARTGDLIITLRGSLANCCLFRGHFDQAFINAQMMIIRPSCDLLPAFVHATLIHPQLRKKILEMSTGAAVPQLTAKQIGDILIPIPPMTVQASFLNKVSAIHDLRNKISESQQRLVSLFDQLQRRGFGTGFEEVPPLVYAAA